MMKKAFVILLSIFVLSACSNNGGERGTTNDGFDGVSDTNGALPDTPYQAHPSTDTAKGEHRVDTEKRNQ